MSNDLRDAAICYRERGWSVIPISPKTKRPLVKWAKYQDKIASEKQINAWWKKYPNASVAIITGKVSNLVVIDVDVAKGGKFKELYRHFPTPLVAKTGGGGYHLFYSYPDGEDIRNSVGEDGYDVRAMGGYVVAAPSIHKSGERYGWMHGEWDDIPNKPPIKWLKNRQHREAELRDPNDKWITRLMEGVPDGQRNKAAERLTGYYLNHMPRDVVVNLMLEWDKKNDPPLGNEVICTTVASISRKKERDDRTKELTRAGIDVEHGEEFMGLTPWDRYMAKYGTESAEWIIKDWLPNKTALLMVAAPGSFKTWMLLDLAISVSSGKPFLGHYPVEKTGSVLIFQQEDWGGLLAERAAVIAASRFDMRIRDKHRDKETFKYIMPPNLPIHFHEYGNLNFTSEESMDALEEHLERLHPRLVLIDPLYSAAATEDYMAGSSQKMLRLKNMRRRYSTSFGISHHTRKVAEKGRDRNGKLPQIQREDVWGSQYLNAWLESGWQMRREDKPNTIQVLRHFKSSTDVPSCFVNFDIDTKDKFKYAVNVYKAEEEDKLKNPGVMEILDDYGPLRPSQLADLMGKHRSNIMRNPLVRGLLDAGEIKKGKDGKIYKLNDD